MKKSQIHSLPGGGYRDAATSSAVYPLVDHQGSVRAYAGPSGIVAAYDYYPYGAVAEIYPGGTLPDERRWQDKELDDATGNYYFGARFYNPLLGMWLTPDPAGQYMNPYGYGGDPVNLIDPSGLWAIGAGLVVGYDRAHGFSVGVGAAYDIGVGSSFNASYSWNSDGSYTANLSASMSVPLPGVPLWANFGGGYSYNSETGHALTGQMGACAGIGDLLCSGESVGGGLYWSNSEFLGGTAYVEAYASVGGVYGASVGKEWGYGNVAGRGWYMGINAAGAYAGVSRNGGLDWGFEEGLYFGVGDNFGKVSANGMQNDVSMEFWNPYLGILGHFKLGNSYDTSKEGIGKVGGKELLKMLNSTANASALVKLVSEKGMNLSMEEMRAVVNHLANNGYSSIVLSWPFDWSTTYDKLVVWKKGEKGYPHVEFKYAQDGGQRAFSSYNYGGNVFSHLLIDFFGYYLPRIAYGIDD